MWPAGASCWLWESGRRRMATRRLRTKMRRAHVPVLHRGDGIGSGFERGKPLSCAMAITPVQTEQLKRLASDAMLAHGLLPDFTAAAQAEANAATAAMSGP